MGHIDSVLLESQLCARQHHPVCKRTNSGRFLKRNKDLKMAVIKGFQHGRQYNDFILQPYAIRIASTKWQISPHY